MEKFSPSRLKTYETCPRKYRFIYIDNLGPQFEKPRPELYLGNQIHAALRHFFETAPQERTLDLLHHLFRRAWASDGKRRETFADAAAEIPYGKRGLALLEQFFNQQDTRVIPYKLEEWVECPVDEKNALLGKIDRVDREPDGSLHLIDYKTGKAPSSLAYVQHDLQLPVYWLMAEATFGQPVSRISYLYLDRPQPITLQFGQAEIEAVRERVRKLIQAIESDQQFLPVSNPLCRYCDFQSICPLESRVSPQAAAAQDAEIEQAVQDLPF
ncbi:MAG: PD-(D/E)XK nuclease family protein [Limnochordaceae bacterium]|nr:PD-(D/E)XK nuclease family protein [Limnochordaceae bacterium]